jgi:signal transduction histidine kinase
LAEHGTADEQPLLLATLPPSDGQRKLAFAVIAIFGLAFAITVPFAHTPLPRLDAWLPAFMSALVINDFITSALLFSQFAIIRQRALFVLAIGYLFSGLIIIPYVLTFPGMFAPTGLLGAGLQSAVWFYIVWHIASPLSVIVYELTKDAKSWTNPSRRSVRADLVLGIAIVSAVVGALIWLFTAHHDVLPELYADATRLSPLVNGAAAVVFLLCATALALLWRRGSSILDLWLKVTVCAWLLEITLNGLFLTARFSLAWYVGRTFSLIASSIVLIALLSETMTLYAQLARSIMRQRAARQARYIAMDTMAASIAHELRQPLGAITLNAEAALLHLARTPTNNDQVQAALEDIAAASVRGGEVIAGLRAMFKKDGPGRASFDANELVREVLGMLDVNLRAERVSVSTALGEGFPQLLADRVQLQQVFLNLITNAIEAMHTVTDRPRTLRVTSNIIQGSSEIVITIEDSGAGIDREDQSRIFQPFFTTKSAGMGIGLTICRSIIDSHGGSLRASANNPYGTIFEVVVPIDGGG